MKKYCAIEFIVRRGRPLSVVVGLLMAIGGLACAYTQQNWWIAVVGVILGAAAWGVVRLLAEIVEVISETLLPR
jgi:hypothetical protein